MITDGLMIARQYLSLTERPFFCVLTSKRGACLRANYWLPGKHPCVRDLQWSVTCVNNVPISATTKR